jgi:hypothetical protein
MSRTSIRGENLLIGATSCTHATASGAWLRHDPPLYYDRLLVPTRKPAGNMAIAPDGHGERPVTVSAREIADLRIQHEREIVDFERSRADSADAQAGTTGAAALAIGAIAATQHPDFNALQIAAAGLLVLTTIAAVIARARYPPPLRLMDRPNHVTSYKRSVDDAEQHLHDEFNKTTGDSVLVRSLIAEVWVTMAARERFRAARKNRWLTLALYGLWLGLAVGVVGFVLEGMTSTSASLTPGPNGERAGKDGVERHRPRAPRSLSSRCGNARSVYTTHRSLSTTTHSGPCTHWGYSKIRRSPATKAKHRCLHTFAISPW